MSLFAMFFQLSNLEGTSREDSMDIEGKTILVTGAGSGLGAGL